MKSIISFILGGEIDDYNGKIQNSYQLNGKCAIQYMINVGPGKITEFTGIDDIIRHPSVVDVQQRLYIGDIVHSTGDIKHRAGEVSILVERETYSMKEVIRFIQKKLKVLDEYGNNMLISPFDYNKIDDLYVSNFKEDYD